MDYTYNYTDLIILVCDTINKILPKGKTYGLKIGNLELDSSEYQRLKRTENTIQQKIKGDIILLHITPDAKVGSLVTILSDKRHSNHLIHQLDRSMEYYNVHATGVKCMTGPKLLDLTNLKYKTVRNVMFESDTIEEIIGLDQLDFSEMDCMDNIFKGCTKLKKVVFGKQNLLSLHHTIISLASLFKDCTELEEIDASGVMIPELYAVDGENCDIFYGCDSLRTLKIGEIGENAAKILYKHLTEEVPCKKLENLVINNKTYDLNISENQLNNTRLMKLNKVYDCESFDLIIGDIDLTADEYEETKQRTTLLGIDILEFDGWCFTVQKNPNIATLIADKNRLTSVKFDSLFKFINTTSIQNLAGLNRLMKMNEVDRLYYTFAENNSESIDFNGFDTSRIKSLECMFYNASKIEELDFSCLDLHNVENIKGALVYNYGLRRLDISNIPVDVILKDTGNILGDLWYSDPEYIILPSEINIEEYREILKVIYADPSDFSSDEEGEAEREQSIEIIDNLRLVHKN